jgi:hypothetical protein
MFNVHDVCVAQWLVVSCQANKENENQEGHHVFLQNDKNVPFMLFYAIILALFLFLTPTCLIGEFFRVYRQNC